MTRWSEIVNGFRLIQNKWGREVRSIDPDEQVKSLTLILYPFSVTKWVRVLTLICELIFFWQKIGFVKVEEQTHFRVDPKVTTDTNHVSPLDITARRSSCKAQVQLFNVFAEYVQLPVESKIQAVRALIEMCKSTSYNYDVTEIEREDPQKRSVLDMFNLHLESLPLDKVTHRIFIWSCVN